MVCFLQFFRGLSWGCRCSGGCGAYAGPRAACACNGGPKGTAELLAAHRPRYAPAGAIQAHKILVAVLVFWCLRAQFCVRECEMQGKVVSEQLLLSIIRTTSLRFNLFYALMIFDFFLLPRLGHIVIGHQRRFWESAVKKSSRRAILRACSDKTSAVQEKTAAPHA